MECFGNLRDALLQQRSQPIGSYWNRGMVGANPIRVAGFLILASLCALCQQPQTAVSLPDAPSAQRFVDAQEKIASDHAEAFALLNFYKDRRLQDNSDNFFTKRLYPTLLRRSPKYHPVETGKLVSRATYAASRTVITREESGRARLNTPYLLRVLSSTALHAASTPYWRRTTSEPLSDFGSTVGSDAGMNVLHEFQPGIEGLLKNHTPKFVSALEQRIGIR